MKKGALQLQRARLCPMPQDRAKPCAQIFAAVGETLREIKNTAGHYDLPRSGADDEARTRYLHLGKVALYRMSYIRTLGA